MPTQFGTQIISVEIVINWIPLPGQQNTLPPQSPSFVLGNSRVSVQVNAPFDWGPIVSGVLITVLGGVFVAIIAWLSNKIWKSISTRRENKTKTDPIQHKPASPMHKKRGSKTKR